MNLSKDARQHINRLAHFIAQRHFEDIRQRLIARAVELRRTGLNEAEAVEQLRRSMTDAANLSKRPTKG